MTEAQAKESLQRARRRAARFRRLRNLWRAIVRRRLARLKRIREEGPILRGNLVEGGSLGQRIAYLFEAAPKLWRLYYSEQGAFYPGRWAAHNVPDDSWRSDCSSWPRAVVLAVRPETKLAMKIINAAASIYTGWVIANCPEVDRHYAETHIGTAVVYGASTGFHMGLSLGGGSRTIEHGTPSLDYGSFDEFGEGTQVRYFQFLT